jgi:membrane protein
LIFAYYLATFANYTATYAGLASVMIVLVFLYMLAVIFILGAEINAALMKFKVRRMLFGKAESGPGADKQDADKQSEADAAAKLRR